MLADLDLFLFGEGTHRRLWQLLGAHAQPTGGVRFSVWAPNATAVYAVGDWNNWGDGTALEPQGNSGIWAGVSADATVGHRYKYAVVQRSGDTVLKADPVAQQTEVPPSTASVVPSEATYLWGDQEWMSNRSRAHGTPLRVYEVHLGSWRPWLTNYQQIAAELADHVAALGFTHVELLPVAEHPFGGSWGYQVSGYYAPTARFGTPDDFRAMVDHLHQRGIGVIIDWVPAHFPKDEWALARFDGTALYEHDDPRLGEHPDWGTHVFNYGRHEVRNFLVANALYWLHEFHIDGLRVDAVASMLYLDYSRRDGEWIPNRHGGRENLAAIEFLQQLNSVVLDESPSAMVIAEESTAWPKVTHPVEYGGLGFSHKWNMGWMHDTLAYFQQDPVHRKWHHHELTFGLLYAHSEQFVLPLSHDEVVHGKGSLLSKMPGDDWQRFANLRALYAWMWAMPGAPLLFMGAEMAPFTEWNESAGLPWHLLDHAPHRGVRDLLADLNRIVGQWPAIHERDHENTGFQWLDANDGDRSTYSFLRWGYAGGAAVACVANFTPVPRGGYRMGVPFGGDWELLVNTDLPNWGGSGFGGYAAESMRVVAEPHEHDAQPWSITFELPPLATLWFGARRS
jgi:1,4-alpha-glucan branching enzyme